MIVARSYNLRVKLSCTLFSRMHGLNVKYTYVSNERVVIMHNSQKFPETSEASFFKSVEVSFDVSLCLVYNYIIFKTKLKKVEEIS